MFFINKLRTILFFFRKKKKLDRYRIWDEKKTQVTKYIPILLMHRSTQMNGEDSMTILQVFYFESVESYLLTLTFKYLSLFFQYFKKFFSNVNLMYTNDKIAYLR